MQTTELSHPHLRFEDVEKLDQLDKVIDYCLKRNLVKSYNRQKFYPFGYGQTLNDIEHKLHDTFNTFTEFPMEKYIPEQKIDVTQTKFYAFLTELESNFTSEWILYWLAHLIQKPYEKQRNYVFLNLENYNGKKIFFKFISSMIGSRYVSTCYNAKDKDKLLYIFNSGRVTDEIAKNNSDTIFESFTRYILLVERGNFMRLDSYWKELHSELDNKDIIHAWYDFLGNYRV